jgi:hypothetical protein
MNPVLHVQLPSTHALLLPHLIPQLPQLESVLMLRHEPVVAPEGQREYPVLQDAMRRVYIVQAKKIAYSKYTVPMYFAPPWVMG